MSMDRKELLNEINSLKDKSDYYPHNLKEAIDKANDLYRMWMKQGNKEDAITIGFLLSHDRECPSCKQVEKVVGKCNEELKELEKPCHPFDRQEIKMRIRENKYALSLLTEGE